MSALTWMILAVGLAATIEDLWHRRISNGISVAALASGLGYHLIHSGWMGAAWALAGAVCGFLVFLVFYVLGGMGGGDVKLMAGFGALLGGPSRLLEAALWTAGLGGLMALLVLAAGALWNRWKRRAPAQRRESIPYAPAITLGVWLTWIAKH